MAYDQKLPDAIQMYFDALYFCDTKLLNSVFHPSSSLFDADEGSLFVEPIASFSKDVASRTSPASRQQQREDEILICLLYTSPSPRDATLSRMPSSS